MNKKSVIIIGGGIAGLSTGCYMQMNGFETRIYEMHGKPGGLCTAWKRKGFTIDGCIHWLVGSAPGNSFYRYWKELGVLPGLEIINLDRLAAFEGEDGRVFSFYSDTDHLEQHMKELSPQDAKLISRVCGAIRRFAKFDAPADMAPELMNTWDTFKMILGMLPYMGDFGRYSRVTQNQLAEEFSDPLLKYAWKNIWPGEFAAVFILITLAWFNNRQAGYPLGGSMPISRAVEKRYSDLGGSLNYKARATKILVENDRAVGIRLEDGSEQRADYVVSAADGYATIFEMLEGKYADDALRRFYQETSIFNPLVYIGLGINRDFSDFSKIVSGYIQPVNKPFSAAGVEQKSIMFRVHNFDPNLAPAGKTVITSVIESSYSPWEELKKNPEEYNREKEKIAAAVIAELENRFPGLKDQIEMIDVATPVTFKRYTGNWQGSYEGWLMTPKMVNLSLRQRLPGLGNFLMAGQWVSPGGGLPSGVLTGRYAAQILCHEEKKKFMAMTK